MPTHSPTMMIDSETATRVGAEFWRKWQETVSDAAGTWFEATKAGGPVHALSAQMEFGMRNAQRWTAWDDAAPAQASPAPAPAAEPEPVAAKPTAPKPMTTEPAATEPSQAAAEGPAIEEEAELLPVETIAEPQAVEPKANEAADDLTRIRGIGPAIAAKLLGQGVTSYRQIAALSDADVARLDVVLDFRGRIERDDWVAQAAQLASRTAGN